MEVATVTFLPDLPIAVIAGVGLALLGLCAWQLIVAPRQRIAWIRRTLMVLLVAVMVARPGIPGGEVPTGSVNVNVFIMVDTTQSVAAEDWGDGEQRLTGMRDDVIAITNQFAGANIAVITFDASASLRVPLTDDGSAVIEMMRALRPELSTYSRGSSISIANQELLEALQAGREKDASTPQIVFYLGDGEQTASSEPESFEESASLISAGFVFGYGTEAGGRMIETTISGNGGYIQDPATGTDALSKIDVGALETIADQLGISFLQRSANVDVEDTLSAMASGTATANLDSFEEARLDLYWVFAAPLFLLIVWELAAVLRSLRSVRGVGGGRDD
ncbi:vWA domain-containing protein [Humidisolicoccus flavus]|uniref:vWA domain-containing protein n=1 Tax=Humidisolicoccus flavus TaxID=3111414 RepID=UPI0032562B0E